MYIPSKLEDFLSSLDRELAALPVSDRADILVELKTHAMEAVNSGTAIATIIDELGSPREVADRYLRDRGLQRSAASMPSTDHRVTGWRVLNTLIIGAFVIMALVVFGIPALFFSPLFIPVFSFLPVLPFIAGGALVYLLMKRKRI